MSQAINDILKKITQKNINYNRLIKYETQTSENFISNNRISWLEDIVFHLALEEAA